MILITTQLQVTTQYTPESPSHLVYCGKLDQAARSLQWLRGDAVDVSRELATIQINVQRSRQEKVNVIPIFKLIRFNRKSSNMHKFNISNLAWFVVTKHPLSPPLCNVGR